MPKFQVKSPDGVTYEVNAPDGATEEQAIAYVQQQHAQGSAQPQQQQQPAQADTAQQGGKTAQQFRDAGQSVPASLRTGDETAFQKFADFGNDLGDSTMHHLANLPLGLAQLAGHGIGAAADAVLPQGNSVREAIAGTNANFDNRARQRETQYQRDVPTNAASVIGATVGEVAPWLIGIGEARALGLIPEATTTLGKIGLLSGEGAAMGVPQPVTGNGSYAAQKALQVGSGAVVGPLAYGALKVPGAVSRTVADAVAHARGTQGAVDKQVSNLFQPTQANVNALRGAKNLVPGETPSAAQVLGGADNVQAERVLRTRAESAPDFVNQDAANNAARQSVITKLAGTDAELAAAQDARTKATKPFIDANLQPGQNPVDPTPVLQALTSMQKSSLGVKPTISKGVSSLIEDINSRLNPDGTIDAGILDAVRQNANSFIAQHSPNGVVGTQEQAALVPIKNTIQQALGKSVPGYSDYLAAYAKGSEPINTMQSVRALVDPNAPGSLNVAGDPQLAISRIRQVLRGDDKARYPMSDAARNQLENVRDSLKRRSISDNKIGPAGSNTAADLNATGLSGLMFGGRLGAKGGPIPRAIGAAAGGLVGSTFGPVGTLAGAGLGSGLSDLAGLANSRLVGKVGRTAASSSATADALERELIRMNIAPSKAKIVSRKINQLLLGTP